MTERPQLRRIIIETTEHPDLNTAGLIKRVAGEVYEWDRRNPSSASVVSPPIVKTYALNVSDRWSSAPVPAMSVEWIDLSSFGFGDRTSADPTTEQLSETTSGRLGPPSGLLDATPADGSRVYGDSDPLGESVTVEKTPHRRVIVSTVGVFNRREVEYHELPMTWDEMTDTQRVGYLNEVAAQHQNRVSPRHADVVTLDASLDVNTRTAELE